jgi:hypothetical protein
MMVPMEIEPREDGGVHMLLGRVRNEGKSVM